MASNNRKTSRWPPKHTDDRTRQSSRPQETSSFHGKKNVDTRKIQETLDEMFINVFDSEIIRSVAHSCGWDLSGSIEALIMLAEGDNSGNFNMPSVSRGAHFMIDKPGMSQKSPQSHMKNVPTSSKDIVLSTSSATALTDLKNTTKMIKSKSVMMNASHGPIKVMYKGQDDPDISDDDADIVIEEEKEIEVSGVELDFENASSQSMCQFLTHSFPLSQMKLGNFPQTSFHIGQEMLLPKPNKLFTKSKESSSDTSIASSEVLKNTSVTKKTKHWPQFERIKKQINENIKVMVLLRGVPGSGKTSLARHIIKVTYGENHERYIFSSDQYFILVGKGKYAFDPKLLPEAHKWNQQRVHAEARNGTNPILIDNTNIEAWEMKPYVQVGVDCGYNIELLEPRTSWRYNSIKLERKNIHNVSRRKIEDMLLRFERDLTPGKLMVFFDLRYEPHNLPPQYTVQKNSTLTCKKDNPINNSKKKAKVKKPIAEKSSTNVKSNLQSQNFNITKQELSICQSTQPKEKQECSWEEILSILDNSYPVPYDKVESSNNSENKVSFDESASGKFIDTSDSNNGTELEKFLRPTLNTENSSFSSDMKLSKPDVCDTSHISNQVLDSGSGEDEVEGEGSNMEWEEESLSNEVTSDLEYLTGISNSENLSDTGYKECTEYVLVMEDGTLLPQKSHSEIKCDMNCPQQNSRTWEYVLMTKDSKLMFSTKEPAEDKPNLNETEDDISQQEHLQKSEDRTSPSVESITVNLLTDDLKISDCKSVLEHVKGQPLNDIDSDVDLINLTPNTLNIAFTGIEESVSHTELQGMPVADVKDNSIAVMPLNLGSNTAFVTLHSLSPLSDVIVHEEDSPGEQNVHNDLRDDNNKELAVHNMELDDELNSKVVKDSACSSDDLDFAKSEVLEASKLCSKLYEINKKQTLEIYEDSFVVEKIEFSSQVTASEIPDKEKEILCDIDNKSNLTNHLEGHNKDIDILNQWEEGEWEDRVMVNFEKIKQSTVCSTPKPARINKRSANSSSPIKFSNEESNEKMSEPTMKEPTLTESSWSVVDEPMESWGVCEDKRKCGESKEIKNEAQPQREQFALGKVKEDEALHDTAEKSILILHTAIVEAEQNLPLIPGSAHVSSENNDTVLPIESVASTSKEVNEINNSTEISVSHKDSPVFDNSTNTHHLDFIVLNKINLGGEVKDSSYRIIETFGRNIIENEDLVNAQNSRKVLPILLLDKSSMTSEDCFVLGTEDIQDQLKELVHMFPSCSVDDLIEIFEKCNKDINWTVDLLLESASQGIVISSPGSSQKTEALSDVLIDVGYSPSSENVIVNNPPEENVDNEGTSNIATSASLSADAATTFENNPKTLLCNKRNAKRDRNAPVSEVSLLIKKQFEENIIINEEHYSEHVSRIRKIRRGELTNTTEVFPIAGGTDNTITESLESDVNSEVTSGGTNEHGVHDLHSDVTEWEACGTYPQDFPEEEETVSLHLDNEFADHLHSLFGTVSLPFNQAGANPCLNLPLSLVRQLHYYLMEAEQNTYDLMMQEDEELARKLQFQDDEVRTETHPSTSSQVPDLREIMDMEMALALYKADQKQNTPENDDLATKLTKNLLCEWFPTLPRDVLVNVFEAHNGSFEDTLEVLVASTEEDNSVRIVMTPEARAAHEKALLQKASLESKKSEDNAQSQTVYGEKTTQEIAIEDAKYYRAEAARHYKLRYECQQKAQKTFQRGLTAVASYYSQMASLHKEKIEKNNAKAASSLLLAHSLGNLTTTLDLHFLYVVEALQVLDIFLDRHVSQLMESGHRHEHLFVITGRGARSSGGRSRLKPAIIQRLEQRGLRHMEVNPGLLKVTITRNTISSTRNAS